MRTHDTPGRWRIWRHRLVIGIMAMWGVLAMSGGHFTHEAGHTGWQPSVAVAACHPHPHLIKLGCSGYHTATFETGNGCGQVLVAPHSAYAPGCTIDPPPSLGSSSGNSGNKGSGTSSSGHDTANACPTNSSGQLKAGDPSYCGQSNWSCSNGQAGACVNGRETTTYPSGCPQTSKVFSCGSGAAACQGPSLFVSCINSNTSDNACFEPTRTKSAACGDTGVSGTVRNGANYIGTATQCAKQPSGGGTTTTTGSTGGGTTTTSTTSSLSCPSGQESVPVTTYQSENQCTPTYGSQTYTYAVQVPVTSQQAYTAYRTETQTYTYQVRVPQTRTGTRYVRQAYTAYRTVPVTTRVWINTSHWATSRHWVSTGRRYECYWAGGHRYCHWATTGYWATSRYWVSSGYWASHTSYRQQAYTAYRTVSQTYTYTVYVTENRTGTRQVQVPYTAYRTVTTYQTETRTGTETVQTGESCQTVTVPTTTNQCEPVTVTTTTQAAGPKILNRCMPYPTLKTYHGQPILPPTHDNWVTAGGAKPNTLLPGPGWAIYHTPLQRVTTTCVGTGASQSCTQSTQPAGVGYQEFYDPNHCPYPVVQVFPNPTVSQTL